MTEQRRTAPPLVFWAFGLGLLGLVLCVVPWTSASTRNEYVGQGSNSVTQLDHGSLNAPPAATSEPADPGATGRGVLAPPGKASSAPRALRNPYTSSTSGGGGMDWTHMPAFPPHKFGVVVGAVSGMYPGRTVDLPVTFVNTQGGPIFVRTAQVTATGPARCGPANLDLATVTFATPIRVSAKSSATKNLPFGMLPSAPDGCQGASFTVTVTARATSA